MSIFLEEILEKVKDSDLEHFREKITKMEEEQEARITSQGLDTVDTLVKKKYLKQIEDIDAMYVDATPLEENKPVPEQPVEQNSDTLYQEFLKKLKG
jgi:hypothetical protein